MAEHKVGAGRGARTMVMLTLGTGVGGGVIIDGKLLRDGGELGHVVIEYDGLPCQGTCTGRGHLEGYASGTRATKLAQEAFGPAVDAHRLVRLAAEGDQTAVGILDDIGRRLGAAIGSFVNIFRPQLVVVGGGFSAAGDFLLEPAREVMRREALPPARDRVEIVRAEIAEADLVLCEDTRRTRTLLDRHGVRASLVSYHRHNEAQRVGEVLPRLRAGERVALVSDAG